MGAPYAARKGPGRELCPRSPVVRRLAAPERDILDTGQVATKPHLHDDLDTAVAAAYGWPANLPITDMVAHLVALNRERPAEEAEGQVRWLRPK